MIFDQHAIEHFLSLARAGKRDYASTGEMKANALLTAIVNDVPGLDSQAVEGVSDFLRLFAMDYSLAMKLVKRER
jgi:hypothetical protein